MAKLLLATETQTPAPAPVPPQKQKEKEKMMLPKSVVMQKRFECVSEKGPSACLPASVAQPFM